MESHGDEPMGIVGGERVGSRDEQPMENHVERPMENAAGLPADGLASSSTGVGVAPTEPAPQVFNTPPSAALRPQAPVNAIFGRGFGRYFWT